MKAEELKQEIDKLELSEKLLLVEDVWDAIARSNAQLPLAEWQTRELEARLKAYDEGDRKTRNWNEVHDEIRNKYK